MATTTAQNAERLSREFIHAYWGADIDRVAAMLADDFVWIGAQDDEYSMDKETAVAEFRAVAHNFKRVVLTEEEYHCIHSTRSLSIVIGQYLGYTDPQLEMLFSAKQRLTLIWRKGPDGNLLLAHYHVSNPLDAVDPGEKFPKRYAQETFRYVNAMVRQRDASSMCPVRDTEGVLHLIQPFDIEYLEAMRQCTVVHGPNGEFKVRMGIAELADKISGDTLHCLVRAHKSFVVNAMFVISIGRGSLVMESGATVPISPKRSQEVCEAIERARLA